MENDLQREPKTLAELQSLVRASESITIKGRKDCSSSPVRSPQANTVTQIALSAFQRIIEYQPEEYTITVEAGASVSEVQRILAKEGQYLPFDPSFCQNGATIGNMIANGYSGPGAYRYGILRDFIIGLTFIDGLGKSIKTGGKVVKNAAGFDIPKLMIGSSGSLGIITEATFKVFPLPESYHSLSFSYPDFSLGHKGLLKLGRSRFTLDSLDLDQTGSLFIRLSGQKASMTQRSRAIETLLGGSCEQESNDCDPWGASVNLRDFPDSGFLVKVPTTPSNIATLDAALATCPAIRRYSIGGFVSWIHWQATVEDLSEILQSQNLSAQVVSGHTPNRIIGSSPQKAFYDRIKRALDPHRKFSDLYASNQL